MKHVMLLLMIGLSGPALADSGRTAEERGDDHDRAREAVVRRDALPLAQILPGIEQRYQARMVAVELDSKGGRLVYELELITAVGRIVEVVVDAATGDIVKDDLGHDDEGHAED